MQLLTIAGTVGKDAELRSTQNGDDVLNFSLAVDNGKDDQGNKRPATWFDCAVWGKRASALRSHITKGTKLTLSGRPTARAHDGKAYLGINVDGLTFQGGTDRREEPKQDGYGAGGRPSLDDGDSIPFAPEWR